MVASLKLALFTIQDAMTNPSETVMLTFGTNSSTSNIEIIVALSGADLDQVKVSNLTNLVDDTFLYFQTDAIANTEGNQAQSDTSHATRIILHHGTET